MKRMETRMNGRGAAGGFTLIELLVTLAVIAIAISVGVPMYGQFTQNAALSSRTSELVGAITYARSEAVGRRTTIRLASIDGTWESGWEVHDDSLDPTLVTVVDLRGNIDVGSITEDGGNKEVTFDREGRASTNLTFMVCPLDASRQGREIDVNRFGRVTLTKVDCK